MMLLHGVCVGARVREGDKVNEDTGEVKHWRMEIFRVFDGRQVWECLTAEDFGELAVGDVVRASVVLSTFRNAVQVQLESKVEPVAFDAFTPEFAQLLIATGMGAVSDPSAKRAAA